MVGMPKRLRTLLIAGEQDNMRVEPHLVAIAVINSVRRRYRMGSEFR